MSNSNADRNLLCGILALQMDFIDRDQLIEAMSAWAIDKSKSLTRILSDRAMLDSDTEALLDALVEKHLGLHGNDPQQSLASLSSLGSVRQDLMTLDDDQLEASLQLLPTQDAREVGSAMDESDADDLTPTVRQVMTPGDRFQILRPHASGGLGEVSVARDTELNREVALKRIRARFANDQHSRSRFTMEGEITGGLEHPGIVPVYGLGQYADGQPFYAMRFIRGDSLKEAIDAFHGDSRRPKGNDTDANLKGRKPRLSAAAFESVDFRKLLGRFVDVCNAIHYAHSRGVLHRDLKPGNIMLGKYGETLVVDWGLAKLVGRAETPQASDESTLHPRSGSDSAPTQMGSAIGTPAYMSPEQAAGRLRQLGPQSDVYSLGATLYCLLTGVAPVSGTEVSEVLRKVQQGQFAPPRSIESHLPKPLDSICMKAMALQIDDRYQTPAELAEEIERYLADEPVAAYQEPLRVKTRRWLRRNRTVAVASSAAVLVSLLSLGVHSLVVRNKNIELSDLNRRLDLRNTELVAANQRATVAQQLAESNERTARDQANLALSTLTSVISDVQTGLQNVSGSGDVRRRILETSLSQLQQVANAYVQQTDVDHSKVTGLIELAHVILRFDHSIQISPTGPITIASDAGQRSIIAAAIELCENAYEIAKPHATASSADEETKHDFIIACQNLADMKLANGQADQALRYLREADPFCMKLVEDQSDDAFSHTLLAYNRRLLGHAYGRNGETEQALSSYGDAVESRQTVLQLRPTSEVKMEIAFDHYNLGFLDLRRGQPQDALQHSQRAVDAANLVAKEYPENPKVSLAKQQSLELRGLVYEQLGEWNKAESDYRAILKIASRFAKDDPNDLKVQANLASAHVHVGDICLQRRDLDEAIHHFKQNYQIQTQITALRPELTETLYKQSIAQERLGILYSQKSDPNNALQHFRLAEQFVEKIVAREPTDSFAKRHYYLCAVRVGMALAELELWQDAVKQFRKATTIIDEIIQAKLPVEFDPVESRKNVLERARRAELSKLAVGDWEQLLTESPDKLAAMLDIRGFVMVKRADYADASRTADKLCELTGTSALQLYNAACVYALCAASIGTETELTTDRRQQREAWINDAIRSLDRALAAGWTNYEHARSDADLRVLHNLPEFAELLRKHEASE